MRALRPGDTLGILGGGQLGRMLALAAAPLGLRVAIYSPDPDSPAFAVSAKRTVAAYDDAEALARFAAGCQAVTYEFENVPAEAAAVLAAGTPLHPSPQALAVTQDRLSEKAAVAGLGLRTAPFAAVDDEAGLAAALRSIGLPAVLKTRRFGYDGKGQALIRAPGEAAAALASLEGAPAILEGFVPFEGELSVVAARGADGSFAAYDLCANEHRDHILHRTRVPAGLPPALEAEAVGMARRIAEGLDYVGVLAVELFLVGGELLVNEIAPRVHNSGHWTIEGAATSQFEQHVRAVCGWPLGPTRRLAPAVEMVNLIGAEAEGAWLAALAEPGARLHLYGKGEARPGRKMGHVTRLLAQA